jgi:hypothetical protein
MHRRLGLHAVVLLGFLVLATVVTWPLPFHLSTHLTGAPGGDTGVYVWNLWVFRHEIDQGRLPFYTSSILSLPGSDSGGPVNLSLHNYTTFANLLAYPLIPVFGLIATFNLIYLLNIVLAGYCMFLLARHFTGRGAEAWLAGAVFAASPVLISRGDGHFSLVAAAPLPLFILLMRLSATTGHLRYSVAAGATVAWATFCDAYYGVFCVMLGGLGLLTYLVDVRRSAEAPAVATLLRRSLDILLVVLASFIAGMALRGGGPVMFLGVRFSLRTLYTPVLALSVLVALRVAIALRPRFEFRREAWSSTVLRSVLAGVVVTTVILSPVLYAFGERYWSGQAQMPPTYWRSSPPGVDLVALVMPNPNHPLWGEPMRQAIIAWSRRSDGFPEFVGALPWVALGVIAFGWWRRGWKVTGIRAPLSLLWVLLALGPFIHIAGVNTLVPTPWTLLRYVPVISLIRSPSRFVVVVTLIVALFFGMALAHICQRAPARRRIILSLVALLLCVELWPAPRTLYSAEIPRLYDVVAADSRQDLRVLGLPFGVRDGASSLGNYSAESQFFQTHHGKAIVGGYLSRVSPHRKRLFQQLPVLNALMTLSEGKPLSAEDEGRARAGVDRFLGRSHLGYVVIDHAQAPPELADFAIDLMGLRPIAREYPRVLYVPREVPWVEAPPVRADTPAVSPR